MSGSTQVGSDVDAILAGMRRPPPAVDPNYRPPLPSQLGPAAIQPRSASASAFGPGAFGSAQPQPWPGPGSSYGNAPASGLTPSPYTNQPPPSSQPPPPTPGTQVAANRPIAPPIQQSPVQLPPPHFQQGNQPGPWPAAFPNSPRIDPQNAPALPGETPQETADLNRHMGHESGGQNIMNSWAAKNPALYHHDGRDDRTCQGYWQMVNSTWRDGAQKAGVDTRQWPTAMSAPYGVQRQVALALYRAYGNRPWEVAPGAGEQGDRFALRPQGGLSPYPRESDQWGRPVAEYQSAPPRDFGPGPTGQQQSPRNTIAHVMGAFAPLLVGIASLALRLPLSTAITAYGAMARAQDLGQREDYERNRTRYQDQLKEATAQQTLESRDASDAFAQYGDNNPQGLQQALAQVALKYNDPAMYHMAERGDLNGIHQLQQRRDMYNQGLLKGSKAAEEEQQREALNADVAARDRAFLQANPNATQDQIAEAHNRNIGLARQAQSGKPETTPSETQGPVLNVIDKTTGKPTGQQVVRNREGTGYRDANTGQPVQLKPSEQVQELGRPAQPKPTPANPYVQPDQQQSGDVTASPDQPDQPDQNQPDPSQPDQNQPDPNQQGAAPQAPAGPTQTAAATPQPTAQPYQEASIQPTPPPTSGSQDQAQEPTQGPAMRRLTPGGQEIARQYLRGGDEAMRMVQPQFRQPLLDGAMEMQRGLDEIPENLSGDDVKKAVNKVDPGLGRLLDMLLRNKQGEPSGGRMGQTSAAFWTRMNELGVQADPGWSPQQYPTLQNTRNQYGPGGQMGKTMNRSVRLDQLARRLWEDAKDLPDNIVPANELQRWFESGVAGDPKWTQFAFDWHNFAVESQAVVTGGQPTVTLSRLVLDTLQKGANSGQVRTAIQSDLAAAMGALDSAVTGYRQSFPEERLPGTFSQGSYDGLYRLYHGNTATGDLANPIPQIGDRRTDGKTYVGGDPLSDGNWR